MIAEVRKYVFLMMLLAAAWQDYRTQSITNRMLLGFGCVGSILCVFGGDSWCEVLTSCCVGVALLVLSYLSGGGIGEGDGWFFVVSGIFLTWKENLLLLLTGISLCFIWSLPMAVRSVIQRGKGRNCGIPFLPFLLPAGIWLVIG